MTHTHDRYNSLRQYVSYMILFCEEVNAEEIEQTLAELYEPICTMIELMAGLINLDFTPPVKNAPSSPKEMEEYDFIRLVPRDFYWVTGQPGSYSILPREGRRISS